MSSTSNSKSWGVVLTVMMGCVGCSDGDDHASAHDAISVEDTTEPGDTTADTSSSDSALAVEDATTPTDTSDTAEDTKKDSGSTASDAAADAAAEPQDEARVFCVDEINKYRATLGLAPYSGWTSAGPCADGQAKADSEAMKAHSAFGKCGEFAQNECPGWPGPPNSLLSGCLKMMWAEGPGDFAAHGHYINMSSKSYKTVACGFYKTPSGRWWAVQDFK